MHLQRTTGRHRGNYLQNMERWHGVAAAVFGLSPASAFTHAATDIAGTGVQSYYAVGTTYGEALRAYFKVRWKWLGSHDTSLLPEFAPPRPSLDKVVEVNLPGVVAMGLLALLFLVLSFYGFMRRPE